MAVCFVHDGGQTRGDCLRNLNLLAHAQMEELDIGSVCGGFGVCGGDRIRIVSGGEHLSPVTAAEREHLSAEELASGLRLGCQSFPERDGAEIVIEKITSCRMSPKEG